jgi:hypothetical protein
MQQRQLQVLCIRKTRVFSGDVVFSTDWHFRSLFLKHNFKARTFHVRRTRAKISFFVVIAGREQSGILKRYLCIRVEAADFIKVLLTDLSGNGQTKALRITANPRKTPPAGFSRWRQSRPNRMVFSQKGFSPSWREHVPSAAKLCARLHSCA